MNEVQGPASGPLVGFQGQRPWRGSRVEPLEAIGFSPALYAGRLILALFLEA